MKPITGSFFEFDHHNRFEGKYYNESLWNFTEEQWRAKVREHKNLGFDTLILLCSALYNEVYFDFDEMPYAKHIKCKNAIEVFLDESEKQGLKVYLSAGYYGDWTLPEEATTDRNLVELAIRGMKRLNELYGHYSCIIGWYLPDEWEIKGHFDERFISYINEMAAVAHSFNPDYKVGIGPYGTNMTTPDEKYVEQLSRMDLDFIAYQDEVGVYKSTPEQTPAYYKALKEAHDKAGRAALWANVETFKFEGTRYQSALLPAEWDRVKKQIEAVSPYVEKVICYTVEGMMTEPGSISRAGHPETAEKLYSDYMNWLKNER